MHFSKNFFTLSLLLPFLTYQINNAQRAEANLPTLKNVISKNSKPLCKMHSQEKTRKPKSTWAPGSQLVCVSIPKCGTHLLLKLLTLLDIDGISYNYAKKITPSPKHLHEIREINKQGPPNHYKGLLHIPTVGPLPKNITQSLTNKRAKRRSFWTHWPHTIEFENFLKPRTFANFLIIRDPRDMVVSFAYMIQKSREGQEADLDKIIKDLISGKQEYYVPWAVEIQEAYPVLWEKGLYEFYNMYLPWINAQNFMLVKFEDLIGKQGGGQIENQTKTILAICKHIGLAISDQKLNDVINNLFGGTWTFRQGESGGWKKHFTPEIKALFQQDKQLMQLLIDLGYEKNQTW